MGLFGFDVGNDNSSSSTQNTDNSKSFSVADQSTGDQLGNRLSLAEASGNTVNVLDQGAILALKENTLKVLDSNAQTIQRVADSAQMAVKGALDLADKSRQTDTQTVFGTFGKAVPWVAGAVAVLGLGFGIFFLTRKKGA